MSQSLPRHLAPRPIARSVSLLAGMLLLLALLPAAGRADVPIAKVFAAPVAPTTASATHPIPGCDADGTGAVLTTQAAGRPDFCVAYQLTSPAPGGDAMKQEVVDTPVGFAGDASGRPVCSEADFGYGSTVGSACASDTQVGDARANLRVQTPSLSVIPLANIGGAAYLLSPAANEVARVGLELQPPNNPVVKVIIKLTLRPAPNVGLRATIDDLPKEVCLTAFPGCDHPIATDSVALRFWGDNNGIANRNMPKPFALLGTDCTDSQVTKISGTTYDGATAQAQSAGYAITGCDTLAAFAPAFALTTAETTPDKPTGATVTATFGNALATSPPKKVVVTMPDGVSLAAQIAGGSPGLQVCSADAFGTTTVVAANCPAGADVGTVSIVSPLIDTPLTGHAFVGAQSTPGALPDLYLEAALGSATDAPRVKLVGKLSVDDQNRLVATLDDIPQVPVSSFALTFRGGDNAALVTPPTCVTSKATEVATPASGAAAVTNEVPYVVNTDCDAVTGFTPTVAFSSGDGQAGGSGDFVTTLTRPDRTQRISKAVIDLPPGQVATLKGLPECAQDVAAAGGCPASTRVGSVSAQAGVGPAPYTVTGDVFLTARSAGAVAGIEIHVQVKLGDVDLGSLDVPARIDIRPEDLGLRITADVPQRFKGLPLDLRSLAVHLDRAGFPRAPSSCGALSSTSVLTGSAGATANVTAGYQLQGCDKLAFAPTLDAAVTGETKAKGHPTIQIRITNGDAAAGMKTTAVTLPDGVGVDLDQLSRACPQDTFKAGGCPDSAKIGMASGTLAIADEPLGGSVYILKPLPGKVLPGLGLEFTGRFAGRVVGNTSVNTNSQIVSTFDPIPDLPLTTLQIQINGGTGGAILATDGLCAKPVDIAAHFVGWNAKKVDQTSRTVCGAPLAAKITRLSGRMAHLRTGKPTLTIKGTGALGRTLARVDLTLPSGWSLASQTGKKPSRYAKVTKLSLKGSAKIARRSAHRLRVTLPKKGSTSFTLVTRSGTIAVKQSKDRKIKTSVVVSALLTYTDGTHYTVPLVLAPH